LDPVTRRTRIVEDPERFRRHLHDISPINQVTRQTSPILLLHGVGDEVVPLQQSVSMFERLRTAGVTAKLIVRQGSGHPYPDWRRDLPTAADWLDEQLR
jgi:dipeptidyl aminopeptidase/acylaminoacyl peptidase